jgi:hypothetical protein
MWPPLARRYARDLDPGLGVGPDLEGAQRPPIRTRCSRSCRSAASIWRSSAIACPRSGERSWRRSKSAWASDYARFAQRVDGEARTVDALGGAHLQRHRALAGVVDVVQAEVDPGVQGAQGAPRQRSGDDLTARDLDLRRGASIASVEVRRWVATEVHLDDDPVEETDPRHVRDGGQPADGSSTGPPPRRRATAGVLRTPQPVQRGQGSECW